MMRKPLIFFVVVLLGIGLDLMSKKIAFDALPKDSLYYSVVPRVLSLVHAENRGVAFSMLNQKFWPIIVITAAAIVFLAWLYFKSRTTAHGMAVAAMCLMLIGATGNLVDRIFLHYVRDFILFEPNVPLVGQWPVFNVADICITTGVFMYAITELFLTPAVKDKSVSEPKPTAENGPGV